MSSSLKGKISYLAADAGVWVPCTTQRESGMGGKLGNELGGDTSPAKRERGEESRMMLSLSKSFRLV